MNFWERVKSVFGGLSAITGPAPPARVRPTGWHPLTPGAQEHSHWFTGHPPAQPTVQGHHEGPGLHNQQPSAAWKAAGSPMGTDAIWKSGLAG